MSVQYRGIQELPVFTDTPADDGQLTIRIPNPKVYMARQSQWVGKRGKPRCDHCRTSNLKCDRVIPVCNQCSWFNGEKNCEYTPLPTPAHRGIPRCDRCRENNLKCDRNLPICNSCTEVAPGTECNYTPKKKKPHKAVREFSATPIITQKIMPKTEDSIQVSQDNHNSHMFYGHNIAAVQVRSVSSSLSEDETSDQESNRTGRFIASTISPETTVHLSPLLSSVGATTSTRGGSTTSQFELKPTTTFSDQDGSQNHHSHIEPWEHLALISLPAFILQSLRKLDASSMPSRLQFERMLAAFLDRMIKPLKEVASFSVEKYIAMADCLLKDNTTSLPKRLASWIAIHKLCLGSDKYNLIMIPHDSVFSMDPALTEKFREQQIADLFRETSGPDDFQAYYYDILPVREQLYDILTYAHRSHSPAAQMIGTILRLRYGFVTWPMAELYVSLCPVCNPQGVDSD